MAQPTLRYGAHRLVEELSLAAGEPLALRISLGYSFDEVLADDRQCIAQRT